MRVAVFNDPLTPMGSWTGVCVGVLGLGRSGLGALRLLHRHGASVVALEDRIGTEVEAAVAALGIVGLDVQQADANLQATVEQIDLLVVSPGVPRSNALVQACEAAELPILSELELATRRTRAALVVVTGTNGKSTTVSLIHAILEAAGRECVLAGNIGVALSDEVEALSDDGVLVIEASSFQLERISLLHPKVAAVLNVAPDHLDRYDSFEDYAEAKHNLLRNLESNDLFVYAADDERLLKWAASTAGIDAAFGAEPGAASASWIDDGVVWRRTVRGPESLLRVDELALVGRHNLLNVTAAIACVEPFDLSAAHICSALRRFEALPHRANRVATDDGRTWINDSKATNVHAANATLAGLDGPVVLLVGGSGKGEDYAPLADFATRLRHVVCFGAEGQRIYNALTHQVDCSLCASMNDALARAAELANDGDTVLLSPACASFDEFSGFAARGEAFVSWIDEHLGVSR